MVTNMLSFKDKIYEIITENNLSGFSRSNLFKKMEAKSVFDKKNIGIALEELVKEGLVVEKSSFKETKYYLPQKINAYKGKIQGNSRGFGFLTSPELEEDVFIPARFMGKAEHGDIVLVKVNKNKNREEGNSLEGEVLSILERGYKKVVGIFSTRQNATFGFVTPDDTKYFHDIFIPLEKFNGAQNGQKVVAEITSYPEKGKNPEGKIAEVLGDVDEKGLEILSIIRSYNLYEEFSEEVLNSAQKVNRPISPQDLVKRQDYRDWKIITIDGEDAKDLDDAISLHIDKQGHFLLGVHIADVTHYVTAHTPLDKEAFKRGTSVYFPDRVLPMLPRELSNGICSLNENEDRLALSVLMEIDGDGKVVGSEIAESVINSKARMTYDKVNKALEGDTTLTEKYAEFLPMLKDMEKLMYILNKRRRERGSIDFEIPESKIILDAHGKVKEILPYPRGVSNRIIEECMLVTNETIAETMQHAQMPFIYRVHEDPPEEKAAIMLAFAQGVGLKFKMNKSGVLYPKTVQQILAQAEDKPIYNVINKIMLRSMSKARYFQENLGHFGLAARFYCHFTSPIRRYPDLVIHRIIKDFLLNGLSNVKKYEKFVIEASTMSSERERLADNAEREVDDLLKAEFMSNHIGEKFSGIISGVTEFGIFVELDNTCEGLVRLENLPKDYYHFDEGNFSLAGKKIVYRLGDKMEIIVASTDISNKKIEFLPV